MRQILRQLNEEARVLGSMVITPDGIMVSAALDNDLQEDSVAAFAASLLVSIKRSLSRLRSNGGLRSCTLTGTGGKIVFYDMENSYLVVVADADASLDASEDAIQGAISKIRNRRVA